MAPLHSFENTLSRWLNIVEPRRVVEWGPGKSTGIIHRHCPGAYILSIEHDARYMGQVEENHGRYADLRHEKIGKRTRYGCTALEVARASGRFDMAFVDGRRRVECVLTACAVLNPGGVILLHDSEREQYAAIAPLIEVVEEIDETMVARPVANIDWARALMRYGG